MSRIPTPFPWQMTLTQTLCRPEMVYGASGFRKTLREHPVQPHNLTDEGSGAQRARGCPNHTGGSQKASRKASPGEDTQLPIPCRLHLLFLVRVLGCVALALQALSSSLGTRETKGGLGEEEERKIPIARVSLLSFLQREAGQREPGLKMLRC